MSHIDPNNKTIITNNNNNMSKKTDFSIDSLLRVPYLCPREKSKNFTWISNHPCCWKEEEQIRQPEYFNFKNFSQSFTNLHNNNSYEDEVADGESQMGHKYQPQQQRKKEEKVYYGEQDKEEERRTSTHDNEGKEFSWLYCSRFKPPKLPRSKKRGGCKRYGRGPRIPFAPYQISVLENAFKKSQYLSPDGISRLAESLFLTETRIKIWLQNRRARFRREMGKTNHPLVDHCSAS